MEGRGWKCTKDHPNQGKGREPEKSLSGGGMFSINMGGHESTKKR